VELAGIEPGTKIRLNSGNTEFDDAKQREKTRSDLRPQSTNDYERTHTHPTGVKHLPELLSRTYRNRVQEP
jgi:hypothetical protein